MEPHIRFNRIGQQKFGMLINQKVLKVKDEVIPVNAVFLSVNERRWHTFTSQMDIDYFVLSEGIHSVEFLTDSLIFYEQEQSIINQFIEEQKKLVRSRKRKIEAETEEQQNEERLKQAYNKLRNELRRSSEPVINTVPVLRLKFFNEFDLSNNISKRTRSNQANYYLQSAMSNYNNSNKRSRCDEAKSNEMVEQNSIVFFRKIFLMNTTGPLIGYLILNAYNLTVAIQHYLQPFHKVHKMENINEDEFEILSNEGGYDYYDTNNYYPINPTSLNYIIELSEKEMLLANVKKNYNSFMMVSALYNRNNDLPQYWNQFHVGVPNSLQLRLRELANGYQLSSKKLREMCNESQIKALYYNHAGHVI